MVDTSDTEYEASVFCDNCGNEDEIAIERGTRVESVDCPTCAVKALIPSHKLN